MTDIQILTLALTMLGIFAASWFNNSRFGDVNNRIADTNLRIADVSNRITDVSNKLEKRIDDSRDLLRAEIKTSQAGILGEMRLGFERMNSKIDAILVQLANHDSRITRLEERNS